VSTLAHKKGSRIIEDPELRALAVRIAPYTAAERYVLFELEPEDVVMTEYRDGQAIRTRWKTDEVPKQSLPGV
jgi:hypothetical protein